MYFYNVNDRDPKEIFPGANTRTFWGDNVLFSVVEIAPNSLVPLHSHPHEQAGMILEGEMEFTVGGETRVLQVGEIFIIPGGVEHSVWVGEKAAKALDVFSPVREEYKY